ncbi:anti-sigma factor family protein [Schauerella aestuarii]|uniref:anti-sigma factor family protein n=1 Tax=Schauerella aestuarii TaxID=2511204 RepID=UPI001925BB73|nr:hypothetical protein [Achromobacter aestuarii]
MQTDNPISDIDLDAYVDDQLDARRRIDVEAYLSQHSREAMRVMADLRIRDALRLSVSERTTADDAQTHALALRLSRALGRRQWLARLRRTAAAAALFGVGWAGHVGFSAISFNTDGVAQASPAFVDDAVMAHRTSLLRAGMQSQPEVPYLDADEILRLTGIPMPALPEQWRIRDVQVFPSRGGPGVETVVDADAFGAVSVFAARGASPAIAQGLTTSRKDDETIVHWQQGEWAYAVTGALSDTDLMRVAGLLAAAPRAPL